MLFDPKGNKIETTEPLLDQEVASAGGDDLTSGWIGELLGFQDEVLKGLKGGMKEYKKLLRDDQVASTLQQRRDAVLEKEWTVEPGGPSSEDEMAAEFMRDVLDHCKWDDVTDKMLFGVYYGYAVAELLLTTDGSYIFPDQIRVRDRTRFRFDTDRDLRLVSSSNPQGGEKVPDRKFWYFSTGADHDDDPYGLGLAHYLYWPVFFKRNGVKFWLIFLEKYAHPTPIGKFPPGTPKSEQKKLLQALAAMTTDQGIIIPEGMEVDKFETQRGAQVAYEGMIDKMDAAISKINLSQTMTTDEGSSRSQSETHADVRDAVIRTDSKLIDESFQRHPATWLTEWNFPNAATPIISRKLEPEEDKNQKAERDKNIYAFGYQPTEERMREEYGEGYEKRSAGGSEPGPIGADEVEEFSEEDPAQTPDRYAGDVQHPVDEEVARWVEEVRSLLADSGDLAEFSERLVELYPDMDPSQLSDVLGSAMATAELAGRSDVQNETA